MTAPAYLAPAYRRPGNDWAGSNALQFVVYLVPPTTFDAQGNPTNGTGQDITGYIPSGTVEYRPAPALGPFGTVTNAGLVQTLTGALVDAPNGKFSLSLTRDKTAAYPSQSIDATGPSLLLVYVNLTDPSGNLVTVGVQPLFTTP